MAIGSRLTTLKVIIPTPIKAVLRRLVSRRVSAPVAEPQDKLEWEFDWQRRMWLALWQRPEVQAKCLEYWQQYRFLGEILREVPIRKNSVVVDVGCGLSTVLHFVPGRRVGLDPLAHRYASIYQYPPGIRLVTAAGESLPFPDERVDVVFSSNCIDHTTDPLQTAREIARVLRPGGRCVLTCEVFAADPGIRNPGHPHSMTVENLLALVRGFRILDHWNSEWYGLRKYVLGEGPTEQREHILLLGKT